jgi:metal-dependent amidase/aminoacylase/carboxypeptidase family protein
MNKEKLKEAVCQAIEQEKARIIDWAKETAGQPELGFKEIKTSELIRSVFDSLGLPTRSGIALTGGEGVLEGGGPVHLCGHHLQG